MHIPDGLIGPGTSFGASAVAVGALAWCVRDQHTSIDDRQVPLAGMAAAYIFAVQMLNFPVASGTSGHLLGGVLAAVLVGPRLGAVCVSVVIVVQAMLFADGGLSALGLNIVNMALVGAIGGYAIFVTLRRVLPRRPQSVVLASGIAAALAPPLAALMFTLEYALGGNEAASVTTVAASMVGAHVIIGIGEGVITALTVSAVITARPELVWGASNLDALQHTPAGAAAGTAASTAASTAIDRMR
ncbi:MAG: cobalamin biosynthesis protein CbiM [Actinobacteria bacterium]|uniref:Unannotated protein n=1 Tax=freshwater metagenome TaxID=449393 RepID=A0A6J7IUF9_9ZZZZ|nr:cobalamin biosynthesis protein CbiM [Actinomycetota bacterium]MSW92712.1 cobalamin biosynthesis protein CbiM [Actinomycetota bacterium]